jgi:hypothetical protein
MGEFLKSFVTIKGGGIDGLIAVVASFCIYYYIVVMNGLALSGLAVAGVGGVIAFCIRASRYIFIERKQTQGVGS